MKEYNLSRGAQLITDVTFMMDEHDTFELHEGVRKVLNGVEGYDNVKTAFFSLSAMGLRIMRFQREDVEKILLEGMEDLLGNSVTIDRHLALNRYWVDFYEKINVNNKKPIIDQVSDIADRVRLHLIGNVNTDIGKELFSTAFIGGLMMDVDPQDLWLLFNKTTAFFATQSQQKPLS